MPSRTAALAALSVVTCVLAIALPGFSSATFTSSSASTGHVRAAADWEAPQVRVTSPGTPVKEVVVVQVEASDSASGVASVVLELLSPTTGTWTTICTTSVAPYSCSWDTRGLSDGQHSLRARATDRAGHQTISDVVTTTVANRLLVVLDDPGDAVGGTVVLRAAVHNAGTLAHTVRIEYAPSGSASWTRLCAGLTSPYYACSWNTAGLNGEYDLRAVLVTGSTTTTSALVEGIVVDNTPPSVAMGDPGSPLSGTRAFSATATDGHSGIAGVTIQAAATGTTTWRDLCSVTTEPWSCRSDTTALPDGSYAFRARATDEAGNTAISAAVTQRVVDNTVASVSVEAPTSLAGRATVRAVASSTSAISNVTIQAAPEGSTTWTTLCVDPTAPYSCTWDTTTAPDGRHQLRATMTDTAGRVTTSPTSTGHLVDNSPLRGLDVQTANGGATRGRAENSDTLTYTFSAEVDPATVLAGWDGAARNVTVRIRDGALLGQGGKADTLDVVVGSTTVNLGLLNLKQDYVRPLRTAQFAATITLATTTSPQGASRSTVTLRLGSLQLGGLTAPRTVKSASATVWSPSTAVKDRTGRSCSPTPVTETGENDVEF